MHSRIFQIEDGPVSKDERICVNTIPEWFTASIADYVADISDTSRDDEIEWLMRTNFGTVCRRWGDKITFKMDVTDFFEEDFDNFKKAVEKLSKINIDQFVRIRNLGGEDLDSIMFQLREAYDDKFRFYVWYCDELYTMQSWMRHVKPAGVYYIGGIVDYHF